MAIAAILTPPLSESVEAQTRRRAAAAKPQPAPEPPIPESPPAEPGQLTALIATRNEETVKKVQSTKKTGGILSAIAGIGTALACGAAKNGASDMTKTLCSLAGIAVAYVGTLITSSIAKKLVEKDQQKVLIAASQSLRSGEPQALTLPDSNASATVTGTGTPSQRETTVNIFYDTIRVTDLAKINVVAEPYVATKANTLLRATPDAAGTVSARLPVNTPLYVAGKVDQSDWYMVSERVVEGDQSVMMTVGYVEAGKLVPAPSGLELPGKAPPASIARKDVLAVLKCDKLDFRVRDAKGKESKGASELCLGPEGTPISA